MSWTEFAMRKSFKIHIIMLARIYSVHILINNIITLIHSHSSTLHTNQKYGNKNKMNTRGEKKNETKTIKFTHYLHYTHRNMSNIGISICTRNITFAVWRQSRAFLLVYCISICSPKTITSLTKQLLNSIYSNHTTVADTLAVLPVVGRRNSKDVSVLFSISHWYAFDSTIFNSTKIDMYAKCVFSCLSMSAQLI